MFSMSDKDRQEVFDDRVDAYRIGAISEKIFRSELGKLGYNATDIEEFVRFYRPSPPENDDGDADC